MSGPAPRAATIPPSCLHAVFRAAEERERTTGRPVVKLHVGEPYFPPPREVALAVEQAVRDGRTAYTSAEGMTALREALAVKLETENGHRTSAERVFVTPGSCQGLAALFQSLARPGDELLMPELHWPIHLQQVLLAGFRPVFYPLGPGYRPDPDALRAAVTPRTRAVLVNSPANPTGAVLDAGTLRAVLDVARTHDLSVISDEAYEHFVYDGEHVSFASLESGVPEEERRVFSTFTFSKSLAMTGYRLGYVVTPNETSARALRVVQEASIIGPSTPVQYAGLTALKAQDAARANARMVRANRDRALPALREAGLLAELPQGGWYAVLDIASTGVDAETFAAGLLDTHEVGVAPAAGFALRPVLADDGRVLSADPAPEARTLVRLAFCGDPAELDTGVARLLAHVRTLRSRGGSP
ncbi:aminotransferase [Streptomyces capoamus]|uniref:Aminotransferase n=1 Tax=Streptomyces capoamus TaxID=68183 RepID=A0A919EY73_9ACTN|nr:pyridoxal phosphate-dependent aminotransferase [Streptomyces capoamus]GGW20697.1 aminotransferase [Streptomyces libani subsp. rufus]GHG57760.1 aminotransferase [Streptomyces capoamus]